MIPQIFVSYSRKDSNFVRRLVDDLTQKGVDIWLDQRDIKAGERWDTSVQNALQQSDYFMVVLSPESVASENVLDEIAYAMSKKKHVFPILREDCDVPYRLARVQYVDFRGNYQDGIKRLLEQMEIAGVPIAREVSSIDVSAGKREKEPIVERTTRKEDQPGRKQTARILSVGLIGLIAFVIALVVFRINGTPVNPFDSGNTPVITTVVIAQAATTIAPKQVAEITTKPPTTEEPTPTLTSRPAITNTLTITPSPLPRIVQIRYCDRACDKPGAQFVTKYREKTKYVYLALDYQNFYPGMPYTRIWSNHGEEWIRYDCIWQGSESGTLQLRLYDVNGLRSGTWIIQLYISDHLAAESHVEIEGTFDFWDPAGNTPCTDF